MKRLIINADDLGISYEVNAHIEDCIRRGCITSSSLLANSPAFEDGVRIAKLYPHISVGVHLNVVEFAPLTNRDIFMKHGIVNDKGEFVNGAIFCVPIDEELQRAVFEEWDAQIAKVRKVGLVPSHLDSHQHTHTIPALQNSLCCLMNRQGINKVRRKSIPSIILMIRSRKHPTVHLDTSNAIMPEKRNVVYRRIRLFVEKYRSRRWNKQMAIRYSMTDSFFPFQNFYADRSVLRLGGRSAVIELMCHPGHKGYQIEANNLIKDMSWLPQGYQLVSYRDI